MKFREPRGSLAASKDAEVELPDKAALVAHIRTLLEPFGRQVDSNAVRIEPYGPHGQIFIVTLDNYGAVGFCEDYKE